MKKIIYLILVILCLSSIFFFSSKSSNESNSTSKKLIRDTITLVENITGKNFNEKELVNKLNYPVRKLAHFTIFFLLGIFIVLLISTFNVKHQVIISIILCVIYAVFDETHQMFSIGRSPLILDIFIDSFGSLTGILILTRIKKHKKRSC